MTPKYHWFQNYSRLYGVLGIPSEEEENALTNAAFEAFQSAREIEIRPSGAVVAVKHGIFTKICTLAEECELPEGKYKVVYTR